MQLLLLVKSWFSFPSICQHLSQRGPDSAFDDNRHISSNSDWSVDTYQQS